jgi:UDP-N-acetylglucosamine:LPS N-acetylglucosamine transferase
MYLGKPVLMVPVQGNYEQYCNAHDACKPAAGAGIRDNHFNIDRFLNYMHTHKQDNTEFRQWVNSAEEKLLKNLIH